MLERNLRTFVAVVDSGALILAARRLSYSAPAVTQHINALERSLGIQVVFRNHAGVTLTEAGSAILPVARSIVALSDAVEELAAHFAARRVISRP